MGYSVWLWQVLFSTLVKRLSRSNWITQLELKIFTTTDTRTLLKSTLCGYKNTEKYLYMYVQYCYSTMKSTVMSIYDLFSGWLLKFILGPSLHASHVRIFCNHPQDKGTEYKKDTYYELEWRNPSSSTSDRHDVFAEVHIVIAGSFKYYFTVDDRLVDMYTRWVS